MMMKQSVRSSTVSPDHVIIVLDKIPGSRVEFAQKRVMVKKMATIAGLSTALRKDPRNKLQKDEAVFWYTKQERVSADKKVVSEDLDAIPLRTTVTFHELLKHAWKDGYLHLGYKSEDAYGGK
jgi:hypothetical protein